MTELAANLRTVARLGLRNLADIAIYRARMNFAPEWIVRPPSCVPKGPFFGPAATIPCSHAPIGTWQHRGLLFGRHEFAIDDNPPDWFTNPLSGMHFPQPSRPWWRIPDFDPAVGDIKPIWELSRFDWALAFAQRARNGDEKAAQRLERWIEDWSLSNPAYAGPNWKCGQEASIRVMHLAAAALILGTYRNTPQGLLNLVSQHLQRIAPTVSYARAQDNNHGTSEAAALFIGGHWLAAQGDQKAISLASLGRTMLEERTRHLVMSDGAFSQYSVTYQRVMLETLSLVEAWRRCCGIPPFSRMLRDRARVALRWLFRMTSAEDGDAPNCGANDGTQLLPLTNSAYRDFRPAIQLAAVLFEGRRAYDGPPELDAPAAWLGVDSGVLSAQAPCTQSDAGVEGGFATLSVDNTRTVLRVPRFRFRPSQADALHLDVWIGADNVLRDGGTYSYNSGQNWIDYFGGTRSHNTIQFDERDQMPRLSRFLFGKWLSPSFTHFDPGDGVRAECAAGYVDFAGACHARYVNLRKGLLTVEDRISGFRDKAVLRWRLVPGEWRLEGNAVTNDRYQLAFTADVHIFRTELTRGWESRHYLEMTQLPVLEVEVREPGAIRTMFSWAT